MGQNQITNSVKTVTQPDWIESALPMQQVFPIVGLGASTGGLEALKNIFTQVPVKSTMAYVVVVNMTPKQPRMMAERLQAVYMTLESEVRHEN